MSFFRQKGFQACVCGGVGWVVFFRGFQGFEGGSEGVWYGVCGDFFIDYLWIVRVVIDFRGYKFRSYKDDVKRKIMYWIICDMGNKGTELM